MYDWQQIEAFCSRFYRDASGNAFPLLITPYAYPVQFTSIAQNATSSQNVTIAGNADFVLLGLRHHTRLAAGGLTVSTKVSPFLRALLIDSGSGEQFTQAAIDLENYASNDAKDIPLPYPRILSGRSTVAVQLTNYSPAAETYSVDLMLNGVQVRQYG